MWHRWLRSEGWKFRKLFCTVLHCFCFCLLRWNKVLGLLEPLIFWNSWDLLMLVESCNAMMCVKQTLLALHSYIRWRKFNLIWFYMLSMIALFFFFVTMGRRRSCSISFCDNFTNYVNCLGYLKAFCALSLLMSEQYFCLWGKNPFVLNLFTSILWLDRRCPVDRTLVVTAKEKATGVPPTIENSSGAKQSVGKDMVVPGVGFVHFSPGVSTTERSKSSPAKQQRWVVWSSYQLVCCIKLTEQIRLESDFLLIDICKAIFIELLLCCGWCQWSCTGKIVSSAALIWKMRLQIVGWLVLHSLRATPHGLDRKLRNLFLFFSSFHFYLPATVKRRRRSTLDKSAAA